MTAPRPRIRKPVLPKPTETHGQLKVARYLHAVVPGGNPRWIVRPRKAIPAMYRRPAIPATKGTREPAHPWAMWWHVPNEGERKVQTGQLLVDMGLRAGVGDLAFIFRLPISPWFPAQPPFVAQAAFIELKREGGGRLSHGQAAFRDHCAQVGAWWAECRTVAEVDAQLRAWLEPWGLILPPCPVVLL